MVQPPPEPSVAAWAAPAQAAGGLQPWPLRLRPGEDVRAALQALVRQRAAQGLPASGFVVSGIGSLVDARLRLAAQDEPTLVPGPSELLSLAGSLSVDGVHLHMAVASASGQVLGGHLVAGNQVRTTAELLLAWLPGWQLGRVQDAQTGYAELTVGALPLPPTAG